jgi:hypothetical protein
VRKGDRVRIRDTGRRVFAARPINQQELDAWYASPQSKGMNCAGETKLPPRSVSFELFPGTVYTVLKARCAPNNLAWHRTTKMCMIHDPLSGEDLYVFRREVEPVGD